MKIKIGRFIVFGVLLFAAGCASQSENSVCMPYAPQSDEPYFATWENTEHVPPRAQKFVVYGWGLTEIFETIESKTPSIHLTYSILMKRTDSEGNTWYKTVFRSESNPWVTFCFLSKINKSGDTLEEIWRYDNFPDESELVPSNVRYRIWYRQK